MARSCPEPEPPSPCHHQCGFRNGCCKNCYRTPEEVTLWRTADAREKQRILQQAAERRLALEQRSAQA